MANKLVSNSVDELRLEVVAGDNHVGVDPHKKTLTATVLDGRGGTVATASFKVSRVGHRGLVEWAMRVRSGAPLGDRRGEWAGPAHRAASSSSNGAMTFVTCVRRAPPSSPASVVRARPTCRTRCASPVRPRPTRTCPRRSSGPPAMPARMRQLSCSLCGTSSDAACSRAASTC